jgi:hypothetical protein
MGNAKKLIIKKEALLEQTTLLSMWRGRKEWNLEAYALYSMLCCTPCFVADTIPA